MRELIGLLRQQGELALGMAAKMHDIILTNRHRLLIGKYWNEVSRMETSPMHPAKRTDTIHFTYSVGLKSLPPLAQWRVNAIEAATQEDDDYEINRTEFIHLCEQWTAWIRKQHDSAAFGQMASCEQKQIEWIRRPNQILGLLGKMNPRFQEPEWLNVLAVWPDRFAVGRWARIIIWYALQRCLNPSGATHQFGNNWDDASYAFLASYAGSLRTDDTGLQALVRAVFPRVRQIRHRQSQS